MSGQPGQIRVLRDAFAIQRRVLVALFVREMQTRWGRRNLGFAWLFCEPLVFALPVLTLWYFVRPSYDVGLPMFPFLWSGYLPLLLFRHTTGTSLFVVRQNAAVLYHRYVTPLDIFLSRCLIEALANIGAAIFSFGIFYLAGVLPWPYDPPLMIIGFLYTAWWSLAVALIVAALSERSEIVEHIWIPFAYVYMMLSGFPFMAYWLPAGLRSLALTFDAPLLTYELVRGGLFGNLVPTFQYPGYLSCILTVMTFFGLWMMRQVREHIEIM